MEDRQTPRRCSLKTHHRNHLPHWKLKLRETCYKRVREDRSRLLWNMRLPSTDHKDLVKSAMKDILSDELEKIKKSTDIFTCTSSQVGDALWEYDDLHNAYRGDCEEIMLEMQNIFYEDLRDQPTQAQTQTERYIKTWEDEEDEYLARAVFEHMHLNNTQVCKDEVWCPICKKGELLEDHRLIYCSLCELKLNRGSEVDVDCNSFLTEVNIDLLGIRLAEAHADHLDRGCRLKPKFDVESRPKCISHLKCTDTSSHHSRIKREANLL